VSRKIEPANGEHLFPCPFPEDAWAGDPAPANRSLREGIPLLALTKKLKNAPEWIKVKNECARRSNGAADMRDSAPDVRCAMFRAPRFGMPCVMCVLRPPNERIVFDKYLPVSQSGPEPSEESGIWALEFRPKCGRWERRQCWDAPCGQVPKSGTQFGHTLRKKSKFWIYSYVQTFSN